MRREFLNRRRHWKPGLYLAIFAMVATGAFRLEWAALAQEMEASDFKAQLERYPPPNETKLKTLLEGAHAKPEGRMFFLTDAKLTTFSTNGAVEIVATAPRCVFNRELNTVNSDGALRVQSGDRKYLLEGRGFLLDLTNSLLWITNDAHTSSMEGLPLSPGGTLSVQANEASGQGPLDVFSDTLFYDRHAGIAWYRGNVRVVSTNLHMTADSLKLDLESDTNSLKTVHVNGHVVIDYGATHALGEQAIYDAATDTMKLTGNPSWRMGERNGRGDELVLEGMNGSFRVNGRGFLELPTGSNPTNFFAGPDANAGGNSTNGLLQISCDSYEIRTNAGIITAIFHDQVQAVKLTNGVPAGNISCNLLTVRATASNQVQETVAEQNVVVERNDGVIRAEKAVFSGTVVEFTGNPTWKSDQREGSGDRLTVNTEKNEMQMLGRGKVKLPAGESGIAGLATGSTNSAAAGTNQFVEISSDSYTLAQTSGVFQGNVRVHGPQLDLSCGVLMTHWSLPGEVEFRRAEAERNVIADVLNDGETNHITTMKLLYTYEVKNGVTNELVTFPQNTVIKNSRGTFEQSAPLIWNRRENIWRGTSPTIVTTNSPKLFGGPERTRTNSTPRK